MIEVNWEISPQPKKDPQSKKADMKYLIQAGSFRQAVDYACSHNLTRPEWVYLDCPRKARGLRNSGIKVIKTGTYWKNKLEREICKVISSQELEYVKL